MTKFLRDDIVCTEEFFLAFLENIGMMGKRICFMGEDGSLMKGLKVAGLLVCGLLFIGSSVEASGEFSYKNTVIAHRAPDGAIGFVAGPDLPVLKIFRQDGAEPAYYIRFDAAKGSFKKATGIHARIFADGKPIALEPLRLESKMHDNKYFYGWYRLSGEAIAQMGSAVEFSFQLVGADEKVLWSQKGKLKTTEAMQKIAAAEPAMYLREGNIRPVNAEDSVKADSRPRVFLPNVTPEAVKIRIYEDLEKRKKDKEIRADWTQFSFSLHTNERLVNIVGDRVGDGDWWPLVTFEAIPYQGGTLLAMMKDQEGYSIALRSLCTVGMMTSDSFIFNWTGRWRSIAEQWDGFLNDLYCEMSPHAKFPFELRSIHEENAGNRFFIKATTDTALAEGDEILTVDGESIAWYKPNELRLCLLQKQGMAKFLIRHADGTEQELSIVPEMELPAQPVSFTDMNYFGNKKMVVSESLAVTQGNYPELFRLMDESYRKKI